MDTLLFFLVPMLWIPIAIRKPEWGLALVIGVFVFFREGWHPDLLGAWTFYDVKFANIHIMEVLLCSFLLILIVNNKIFRKQPFVIPPYGPFVLLFMLLMLFGAAVGLIQGAPAKEALGYGEWRALFMALLLLFIVPNVLTTPEKAARMINWIFILMTVRLLYGIGKYLLGAGDMHPTLRIQVVFWDSGENLILASLIALSAAELSLRRPLPRSAWLRGGAAVLMGLGLLLSMRRSYWLYLGASLAALFCFLPIKLKLRTLQLGAAGFLLAAGLAFTGIGGQGMGKVAERAASFFSSTADTNAFHLYDIYDAFLTIREHPWTGVGFGRGFTRVKTLQGVGGENVPPNIVHNVYLHLWLKMGIFGFLAFLLMWGLYVVQGYREIRRIGDSGSRARAVGLYCVAFGMLAAFFWGTDLFANTRGPAFIFTLLGMMPVLALPPANRSGERTA